MSKNKLVEANEALYGFVKNGSISLAFKKPYTHRKQRQELVIQPKGRKRVVLNGRQIGSLRRLLNKIG